MEHVIVWVLLLGTTPAVGVPGFPSEAICEKAFEQTMFGIAPGEKKPMHKCMQAAAKEATPAPKGDEGDN